LNFLTGSCVAKVFHSHLAPCARILQQKRCCNFPRCSLSLQVTPQTEKAHLQKKIIIIAVRARDFEKFRMLQL
jgi:hypothetical protein